MPSADPTISPKPALPPQLTLPRSVFAKLAPRAFLSTLLKSRSEPAARPSGRSPDAFRPVAINTGSLTFCAGSAVVRVGDTAIVCGVQLETLLARDVPNPPKRGTTDQEKNDELAELGLLVPNVELGTGCSPQFVPGQGGPPSIEAQGLTSRILRSLIVTNLIRLEDLEITESRESQALQKKPTTGETDVDEAMEDGEAQRQGEPVGYWTLYISFHVLSLSGVVSLFDAAWAAMLAALQDVRLPAAWWDPDRDCILCSDTCAECQRLKLHGRPLAMTWGIFGAPNDGLKIAEAKDLEQEHRNEDQKWVLADPDDFEDMLCKHSITLIVDWGKSNKDSSNARIASVDVRGGTGVTSEDIDLLATAGQARWRELDSSLQMHRA